MDSALFKDLKNGSYMCNVCGIQVKTKIWTAHANGRKHRENIQKLKEALLSKTNQKRKLLSNETETIPKRSRDDEDGNISNDNDMEIESSKPLTIKTPWQTEVNNSVDNVKDNSVDSAKVIEGLPEGFFDNQEMNSRVRETMEKQKHLNSEVDRFFKEIASEEVKKEEEDDEEAEVSAVHNDIELIDEQIARWRTINELEKKKEEIVESVVRNPNFDRVVVGGNANDEEDEDDDEDFDFYSINWRTKIF